MAISVVLLAASTASASASSSPLDAPAADAPVPAHAGADGGTRPDTTFPAVESHLASSRFVSALPPSATGTIPAAVLAAYQRAVARTGLVQPGCHIPFELLAAIGKVESGHARGGLVDDTGRALVPILGPVLNGGPFAAIHDTDGGALDGDPVWDRAVGPMQFIPGTWTRWRSDGNDDGTADPHNINDASYAAARYLCAANRDLGTPAGLDEAVLSYNHSTSYLSLVRSWMSVYRDNTIPVDALTDASWTPPAEARYPVVPAIAPVTRPKPPAAAPPAAPPATTPPPTTAPPSTPPTTAPPTTAPPTTAPPTTPPSAWPPAPPTPPSPPTPGPVPARLCDLLETIGTVAGDLPGTAPECVLPLKLPTS